MSRKTKRQIENELKELRGQETLDVTSSVVTVTDEMVSENGAFTGGECVPDGATVVHDSGAVTAWVRK